MLRKNPRLSEQAQVHHAAMALGGWTFERIPPPGSNQDYWVRQSYVSKNPQGAVVAVNGTLETCVEHTWYIMGGNGGE